MEYFLVLAYKNCGPGQPKLAGKLANVKNLLHVAGFGGMRAKKLKGS